MRSPRREREEELLPDLRGEQLDLAFAGRELGEDVRELEFVERGERAVRIAERPVEGGADFFFRRGEGAAERRWVLADDPGDDLRGGLRDERAELVVAKEFRLIRRKIVERVAEPLRRMTARDAPGKAQHPADGRSDAGGGDGDRGEGDPREQDEGVAVGGSGVFQSHGGRQFLIGATGKASRFSTEGRMPAFRDSDPTARASIPAFPRCAGE